MTALKREELAELIRDAQSSAPTMPGHPRIRRVMIRGEEYVTAEARPGLPGAERFAHERSLLAVAGRTPLADDPFYVDEEVIVHRVIQGTTLHDILLNSWPVDDEVAVTCGVALATLHGSPTPSLPRATDEQPKLFPLGIQEWANTPDAILAVLVQCGRFQDWELLSGRRRPTRQEGAVLIHSDFKPDNICRVHFMRNVLTAVPKASGPMIASIIRTIFAQPDTEHVFAQFHEVVRMLTRSHPKIADMLEDAKDDILAFCEEGRTRSIVSTRRSQC